MCSKSKTRDSPDPVILNIYILYVLIMLRWVFNNRHAHELYHPCCYSIQGLKPATEK